MNKKELKLDISILKGDLYDAKQAYNGFNQELKVHYTIDENDLVNANTFIISFCQQSIKSLIAYEIKKIERKIEKAKKTLNDI